MGGLVDGMIEWKEEDRKAEAMTSKLFSAFLCWQLVKRIECMEYFFYAVAFLLQSSCARIKKMFEWRNIIYEFLVQKGIQLWKWKCVGRKGLRNMEVRKMHKWQNKIVI